MEQYLTDTEWLKNRNGNACLVGIVEINIYSKVIIILLCLYYLFSFLVAVKRIREIMAGADVNLHPPTQPQGMPVSSPVPTPSFNQPLAIFDRQPLPPGVCAIIYKLRKLFKANSELQFWLYRLCAKCFEEQAIELHYQYIDKFFMNCKGKSYQVDYAWTSS